MDYLVLARKWRPQSFEEVLGQEQVIKTLQNAIRYDRIAHAFIFSGTAGSGEDIGRPNYGQSDEL